MRFAPGVQWGKYRILGKLGRGGTCDVYKVETPRGGDLKDKLQSPRTPEDNVPATMPKRDEDLRRFAGLMKEICKHLAHSHSLRIIHRDHKPANIMLTETG